MPSSPQSALLRYIEYAHTRIPADYQLDLAVFLLWAQEVFREQTNKLTDDEAG